MNMKLSDHIEPNIFSEELEKAANRVGYGEGLKEAGEKNSQVVALSADLTGSTKDKRFC